MRIGLQRVRANVAVAAFLAASFATVPANAQAPAEAIVRAGDTLGAIAERYGVSAAELRDLNPELVDPNRIRVGDRVRVRPLSQHVVRRGDTLAQIANELGVSVAQLRAANGLSSDRIDVGQALRVPAEPTAAQDRELSRVIRPSVAERRPWSAIVIHHSATSRGSLEQIDHHHRHVRGFPRGLAYHFLIGNGDGMGDGEIRAGPRWRLQQPGAHVASRLRDAETSSPVDNIAIGICLVGNFENEAPTARQLAAMHQLVARLRRDYGIRSDRVKGHGEVPGAHTACPGRELSMDRLRDRSDRTGQRTGGSGRR